MLEPCLVTLQLHICVLEHSAIWTCLITVQNNIIPDDFFRVADNPHSNHMLLAFNIIQQADIL